MFGEPTDQNAMCAYLAAAAHEYDVPVGAISETDHLFATIEWPRDEIGVFWRIINPKDVIKGGPFKGQLMHAVAICMYGYNGDLWEVDLFEVHTRGGNPFLVQNVGRSFTIVGEGTWRKRSEFYPLGQDLSDYMRGQA